jgi:hypothetical protein
MVMGKQKIALDHSFKSSPFTMDGLPPSTVLLGCTKFALAV